VLKILALLTLTIFQIIYFAQIPILDDKYSHNVKELNPQYIVEEDDLTTSKAHYLKYTLLQRGGDYSDSFIREYYVVNIDNDNYPDLLLWYPKRLIVWSYNRGVFIDRRFNSFVSRPIMIDLNNDGLVDYVIVVLNTYLDARVWNPSDYYQLKSTVYAWYPRTNTLTYIGTFNGIHVDTTTYYVLNNVLFIPGILNYDECAYFGWCPSRYTVKIAILKCILNSPPICSLNEVYSETTGYFNNPPRINDYTTDYQVYLFGSGDLLYVFPKALDKYLVFKYTGSGFNLVKTVQYGPSGYSDGEILVYYPYLPTFAAGVTVFSNTMPDYWKAPVYIKAFARNNYIVIPYGVFHPDADPLYMEPNGVYLRAERVMGIYVFDVKYSTVYKRSILWRFFTLNNRLYTIWSITSIEESSIDRIVYIGGLASTDTRIGRGVIVFIAEYDWISDTIRGVKYYEPIPDISTGFFIGLTIGVYSQSSTIITTPDIIYDADRDVVMRYHRQPVEGALYLALTTIALSPRLIDVDNDGVYEYVFPLEYLYKTGYAYGRTGLVGLTPLVYSNENYIVYFVKSRIRIQYFFYDTSLSQGEIYVDFYSTTGSYGSLTITDRNNNILFKLDFDTRRAYWLNLDFNNVGKYYVNVDVTIVYNVSTYITGKIHMEQVKVNEKFNGVREINVRYPTRISITYPTYTVLTPNSYMDGLTVTFYGEYYNLRDRKWYALPYVDPQLFKVVFSNTTHSIAYTPRVIGKGLYSITAGEIKYPGYYDINVSFTGDTIYAPSYKTYYVSLIKYPVIISVNYGSQFSALTPFNITVTLKYRYLYGSQWVETDLRIGSVKISLINTTNADNLIEIGVVNVNSPTVYYTIGKYSVLPGRYKVKVDYIPPSIYYNTASTTGGEYVVHPLRLYADLTDLLENKTIHNESIVLYGSSISIRIREYTFDNKSRMPSTTMVLNVISVEDNSVKYSVDIHGGVHVLDTGMTPIGDYIVRIEPSSYKWVYNPGSISYYIHLVKPVVKLIVNVENKIVYQNTTGGVTLYSNETYTLTPLTINITSYIKPELLTGRAVCSLRIDDELVDLPSCNTSITKTFIYPGLKTVEAVLKIGGIMYTNETNILIQPMPVRIDIVKGSVKILVYDVLNRPATGYMVVEIFDLSKRKLYSSTLYVENGSITISEPCLKGWVNVRVFFKGNGSYREAYGFKQLFIECEEKYVTPLPEPRYIGLLIVTLLITIYYRRLKR